MQTEGVQKLLAVLQKDPRTSGFANDASFLGLLQQLLVNPQAAGQYIQTDPRLQTAFSVILENPEAQQIFFSQFANQFKTTGQPPQQEAEHQHGDNCHHDHGKPHTQQKQQQTKHVEEYEQLKLQGNEFYKQKNFVQALEFYDKAIELNPTEPIYYNNKVACYLELKQYDQGLEVCELALTLMEDLHSTEYQKKAKLLARKGKLYHLKGQLEDSIKWYEKSLLEDQVVAVKDELRKVKQELKDFTEKSYINPELAEEHNAKGGAVFKSGQFPDAIKEYSEAIKRGPSNPKYYCNRATAYMKLMEFPQALKDLERCLELDPTYLKAYVKKGACHTFFKDFNKAKEAYEKGLTIDPENKELKEALQKNQAQQFSSGGTEEEQKQRANRAMQDPSIQAILREPEVLNILQEMQSNPQVAIQAMSKNKDIAAKIEKLIAAGVLKVG